MRVIELSDLYRPAIGGLERFVALMAEGLAGRGHEVHVVTSAVPDASALETSAGVTVHRIPLTYQRLKLPLSLDPDRPFHPPAPDPLFRRGLAEIVTEVAPDVIHGHSWSTFSCLGRTSPRTPVLVSAHDYGLVCARKTLVDRSGDFCPGPSWRRCGTCAAGHFGLVKGNALATASLTNLRLLSRITTFTAVSRYVADRLSPIVSRYADGPIETLHSFVPNGLFESGWESERPRFLPPDDRFLLYVGQLSTHKGIDVLLDAYRRLPSPPPLVLLGTPHPSSPAAESLPPDVVVRTNVEHRDVIASMVRAACVVVPSVWPEPFPMTVSEAHNCGVPVVASAVGGIPEQVVDGETGWLVPAADAQALADKLARILADPDEAKAMGEAAHIHGRQFTESHGIALFEEALEATSRTAIR
jgi:glycosyltransferase involved in cell wall biosynthesis